METISEISLSIPVETERDYAGDFSAHLANTGRSPRTIAAYLQDVRKFSAWYAVENGEAFAPEKVTSLDLRGFRRHSLERERCSAATWNRRRIALKVLCGWLVASGALNYDPFRGIEPVKQAEPPVRALEKPQRIKFQKTAERQVEAAKTEFALFQALRDQAMIGLMVSAGLREGEVALLNPGDVVIKPRSGHVDVRGKGEKYRKVPLGPEARAAIEPYLAMRGNSAGPLFSGKRGGRLTTRQIQRIVVEIGRLAGLKVTPHDLRHTFAHRSLHELDNPMPLPDLQYILGHSRLEQTGRYAKPTWNDIQDAVEEI